MTEHPETMPRYQMYIDGNWCDPASGEFFESDDPFRGQPWAQIPRGNADDVDYAVRSAHQAFTTGEWPGLHPSKRGALMRRLGDLIAEHAENLARVEVRDNGKLYAEMLGQLKYMPQWYYYFGGLADKIEGSVIPIDKPDHFNYTAFEPLGVIAAIVPWNSPLLILTYKLAPALAAGNTIVIKPSEFTSASALEFMRLVERAGFPSGVVNVVTGFGAEVGAPLVEHPLVAKVTLTGSEVTGQKVYEAAARGLKHVTLELGGKSPNIVFDDANMANAVNGVVAGIFAAMGQTCIAGSRLLVQRSIHDEFVDRLTSFAAKATMGDPQDFKTQIGPLANLPHYHKVKSYLKIAESEGAEPVLGGSKAELPDLGGGWFVAPTVYTKVSNDMRIAREEVFGPVLSVIPFEDEEDAIKIGNDSSFGLASGVWTQDTRRAFTMAKRLQSGTVWINTYRTLSYLSPLGGHKRSGIGHENGQDAIWSYLKPKSVWISTALEVPNPFTMR